MLYKLSILRREARDFHRLALGCGFGLVLLGRVRFESETSGTNGSNKDGGRLLNYNKIKLKCSFWLVRTVANGGDL